MGTLVDELLDAVADDGGMDVMASFAVPLPVIVIAELLGVPPSDRGFFRAQIPRITPLLEWDVDTDRLSEAVAAIGELAGYFTGMFDARRADPRDDLVSALVLAAEDGQGLDPVELMATCVLLLGAGHETTMNLIGNGLMALLTHPTQAAIVRDDPSVARSAVDELLRFDSPVQLTGRTALEPVPLGGCTIDAGAEVVTLLGAANRDPDRWDRPDELDVTRGDAHHLAFGHGAHFCLGAALARVEGEVALPALLRRFPSLRLAGAPVRRPTVTLRGFDSLEVAW
jgi:cytochrome P450